MKHIMLFICAVGGVLLLTACAETKDTGTAGGEVTTPTATQQATVKLKGEVSGNAVDMEVLLPSGTTQNLLDYNGTAKVRGKLKSQVWKCLNNFKSFSCQANLSVGNINVQNCSVGGHTSAFQIVLTRGQEIKTTYGITAIILDVNPQSCFFPK